MKGYEEGGLCAEQRGQGVVWAFGPIRIMAMKGYECSVCGIAGSLLRMKNRRCGAVAAPSMAMVLLLVKMENEGIEAKG